MKKTTLSLVALMAITNLYAGTDGVTTKLHHGHDAMDKVTTYKDVDNLSDMFSHGKTSGQIRMFNIDRQYQGGKGKDIHRNDLALGGHLKFETASFNGLSLATAFYTSNSIKWFAYDVQDPSLTANGENYATVGEAYVKYDMNSLGTKTSAKLGYQTYESPMMGGDDVRMTRNTFSVYKLTNHDIDGLHLQIAHIDAVAYGTFSNIYTGGLLGATSGYPGLVKPQTGKYLNMGKAAVGISTAGVTNVQIKYMTDNFHLKVSNDYAWDLYNTLYADAGTSWTCLMSDSVKPFVQAQIIKQNSVGNAYMKNLASSSDGKIDSLYYAGKFGIKVAGLTAYIAYSETGKNDATQKTSNPYANAIVTQFGGMPAYTQGMVTRHQFLAGTKATKIGASYNFKALGTNLSAAVYSTSFKMDENSGYGIARTATEPGFDIKYYPASVKKLQIRFRGNFPRRFAEDTTAADVGWSEYRLLANYNF